VVFLYRPEADALRQVLQSKAAMFLGAAQQTKDDKQALKLLEEAVRIWPRLPHLQDELLKRKGRYAILNVGVRKLPKYLSPARASTDEERQALELLFESLMQPRTEEDGSLHYVPQLAAGSPQAVAGERRWYLRKSAYWSNGLRVTSADVQRTFELLTSPKLPGRSPELGDLVDSVRAGEDPLRVDCSLRQGLLEPPTPLTFKVLPREFGDGVLARADDENFALKPVGSGPYMFAGPWEEHGRTYVRFLANPYYQGRAGRAAPRIREVRFFECKDPVADFAHKTAPMHLLLDPPTQVLAKLTSAGLKHIETLQSRRVFFLAVNHRDRLLGSESLRRALAHAIDRTQLLADHFGGGRPSLRAAPIAAWGATLPVMAGMMRPKPAAHHHALNGPFPVGSWATCSDGRVPANLFNHASALAFLKQSPAGPIELELKYPDDDPRVAEACQGMAAQLAELGARGGRQIKLRLVARSPYQLQSDLHNRQFQLAFCHYDFQSDAFSLGPLFDPRDEALATGSNFLGFKDDGTLVELLHKAGSHRDFVEVKRLMQETHVLLHEQMPLIPLWQLEMHLAVHPDLALPRVDPLRVFSNIDEWKIGR
jgi:ABC-type transport system substrate-binding protein